MNDHDQRFKTLLQEFFPEFISLFFPDWAEHFDFARTEWLPQDAFLDPPDGDRRMLDLVAKVPTHVSTSDRPGDCLLLIHVEVESGDSAARLRNRMLQYYAYLRRAYDLPVFPIGLFLHVGLDGIGQDVYKETLWGRTLLQFAYFSIGLPALDAAKYAGGTNLLGLALSALMELPSDNRVRILSEGLDRITLSDENEMRRLLLSDCYDTYFPLPDAERAEVRRLVAERHSEGRTIMNGLELRELRGERRGEQRGRLQEKRELVAKQLAKKFGPLPDAVIAELNALPSERLDEIALTLLDATSLAELGLNGS